MNLRSLLNHIWPTRRPDISDRMALKCLQEAARRVCTETQRMRGKLVVSALTNASFTGGPFKESYLRPTSAQLANVVLEDQAPDAEQKTYDPLRVFGAMLSSSVTGATLALKDTDISSLRWEACRQAGLAPTGQNPQWFADAQGSLAMWPWFDQTLGWDTLTLDLAICPIVDEWEQIALPSTFERAVVLDATARAFEHAGRGQSFAMAKEYRFRALNEIAGLRIANEAGTSGNSATSRSQFAFRIQSTQRFL